MRRRILFLAIAFLATLLIGCEKDYELYSKSGPDDNDDDTWVFSPKAAEFTGSTKVNGLPRTDVWDYRFRISKNNSRIDPAGLVIRAPHVGPSGTTIYDNVTNDATYTISVGTDGYIYLTVRTADMTASGCKLKFNLSAGTNNIWFQASGPYVQNPTLDHSYDDGVNNLYCIIFRNGTITAGIN